MTDVNKDMVADQLKQVNASVEQLKTEALKTAENALKEANRAGELSAETKNSVDKVFTDLNNLRQAQNEMQVQLGEAEQLFVRVGNGATNHAHARAGDLVIKDEQIIAQAQTHSVKMHGQLADLIPPRIAGNGGKMFGGHTVHVPQQPLAA